MYEENRYEEKRSLPEGFVQYAKTCGWTVEQAPSGHMALVLTLTKTRNEPEGWQSILKYLSEHPELPIASIDMSACDYYGWRVSLKSIWYLSRFLKKTRTLQRLNLKGTWISELAVGLLIHALEKNTTLQDLNMENVCFGPQLGERLLALVQTKNTTLRKFAASPHKWGKNYPGVPKPSVALLYNIQNQLCLNALQAGEMPHYERAPSQILPDASFLQTESPYFAVHPCDHLAMQHVIRALTLLSFTRSFTIALSAVFAAVHSSHVQNVDIRPGSGAAAAGVEAVEVEEDSDDDIYSEAIPEVKEELSEMEHMPLPISHIAAPLFTPVLYPSAAAAIISPTVHSVLDAVWTAQNTCSPTLSVPSSTDLEEAWKGPSLDLIHQELTPAQLAAYGYCLSEEENISAVPLSPTHSPHSSFFTAQESPSIPTVEDPSVDTSTVQEDPLQQAWKAARALASSARETMQQIPLTSTENLTMQAQEALEVHISDDLLRNLGVPISRCRL